MRSSTFLTFWIAWYIGTVPIGTGLAAMMARRMASMLPPVERSITVSEPRSTAILSLASSLSTSEVTAELPMLALILQVALMPMPIGSRPSLRCSRLAGMTIRPRATSARTSSGSSFSRRATYSISGVIVASAGLFDLGHGANDLRRAIPGCPIRGDDGAARAPAPIGPGDPS